MAVISKEEIDKLILEIDNGDLTKLNEVMKKYGFKDYQKFIRFCVSILLVNQGPSITINIDGVKTDIVPAPDFIKEEKENVRNR